MVPQEIMIKEDVKNLVFRAAVFVLLLVAFLLVFSSSWLAFNEYWSNTTDAYGHGYLLLLMCVYLLYHQAENIIKVVYRPPVWCWLSLFACVFIWVAAYATQIRIVQLLLIPALIALWVTVVFGLRAGPLSLMPVSKPIRSS